MTHIEAMKQALEALYRIENSLAYSHPVNGDELNAVIESLSQAIATEESSATQEPVGVVGQANTVLFNDLPVGTHLYTHPQPKAKQETMFTYEQVKAHIRAASMSANDIVVGSDVTDDGVSIVIRRRDEVLYAEFFAYQHPKAEPVAKNESGKITWLVDNWPQNCFLYTTLPVSKSGHKKWIDEPQKVSTQSDSQPKAEQNREPLTYEQIEDKFCKDRATTYVQNAGDFDLFMDGVRFAEAAHGIKGEA